MPAESRFGWRVSPGAAVVLAGVGAGAGALVTVLLRAANEMAPVWYLVVIGVLAGVATALVIPFVSRPALFPRPAHGAQESTAPPLAPLADLERRIGSGTRQRAAFCARLQPMLRDLVDDRLVRGTEADFDALARTDPAGTRRLLGEQLWSWLTAKDDGGRAPTMAELDALLTRIGSL